MMYGNAWYAIPSNSYIPYDGSDDQFTVSFQINGSNQTSASFPRNCVMFFGGVNKVSVIAKPITGTTLGIGRDSYTSMNVDIYSLRLYSRALTAAEIAANYAIDKERFNLP